MRVWSLAAALALAACAADPEPSCETRDDCPERHSCQEGACVEDPPFEPYPEPCTSDADCPDGEACGDGVCRDPAGAADCPDRPLAEVAVCENHDPSQCACYAGRVSFHEREQAGRLSCAGVVGIFSDVLELRQDGCQLEALDGQLEGTAVGDSELGLRIANLPNETACRAFPDRWAPQGDDGRPAIRIECSPTCTIYMEQLSPPAPERLVPSGAFLMGSSPPPPDRPEETPAHLADVTCFYADRLEVTRDAYLECLDAGPCSPPLYPDAEPNRETFFAAARRTLPMTHLTHRQAEDYCHFARKALPTEAEWERAAQAEEPSRYPWGDDAPTCAHANLAGCAEDPAPWDGTREAGVSSFDVADLAGNAREWTRDFFSPSAYAGRAARAGETGVRNPEQLEPDPALGAVRVVRGGSHLTDAAARPTDHDARVTARTAVPDNDAAADLGFRCVRYEPGVAR